MTLMNANDWGDFSSARPPPAGTGPGGKDQNCGVDISAQYESCCAIAMIYLDSRFSGYDLSAI